MECFDLSGKHALITGGSRGIGLGIARALTAAGARVTLLGRSQENLDDAAGQLRGGGAEVDTFSMDVAEVERIPGGVARIVERFGPVDILVNNAGMVHRAPAESLALADFQRVMQVNVTAVFAFSQAFASHRIAIKAPGRIINIASLMSECSRPMTSAYTASKGAVKMLTKNLAVEWARYGITVNAIGPGYIRTDLTEALWSDPQFDAWVKQRTPAGRWGTPADLGGLAVFLASEASAYVTGQVIYADGGMLAAL